MRRLILLAVAALVLPLTTVAVMTSASAAGTSAAHGPSAMCDGYRFKKATAFRHGSLWLYKRRNLDGPDRWCAVTRREGAWRTKSGRTTIAIYPVRPPLSRGDSAVTRRNPSVAVKATAECVDVFAHVSHGGVDHLGRLDHVC